MITPEQIRAARSRLGWSVAELAARSGVDAPVIERIESGTGASIAQSALQAIRLALQAAGADVASADRPAPAPPQRPRRAVGPEDEERGQQTDGQPFNRDD